MSNYVDFIDEIFCYIIFQHDKQASNKKNIVLILNHYFDARSIKAVACLLSTDHAEFGSIMFYVS